jgi:hypothetical protein
VQYKVHMTVRGDQQVKGECFDPSDLYAPVLMHYEALLQLAITAVEGCRRLSCLEDSTSINGSECRQDQQGFGCNTVYQKLCCIQYYRVLNIINLKLYSSL